MGLDMFLFKAEKKEDNLSPSDYLKNELKKLKEVGYWRKSNQIHNWFVKKIQKNEDNCKPYFVEKKDLEELKEVCQRVIQDKNLSSKLLPSKPGFFFGSTEYDEYYYQDIEETIEIISNVLKEIDFKKFVLIYLASW